MVGTSMDVSESPKNIGAFQVTDESNDGEEVSSGEYTAPCEAEEEEVDLEPIPSIGKAFLIYAALPLFLFMLPTLLMQVVTMDYFSSLSSIFSFFGFTAIHSNITTTKTSPPFNIDREMVSC
jgi:hypothetical protein